MSLRITSAVLILLAATAAAQTFAPAVLTEVRIAGVTFSRSLNDEYDATVIARAARVPFGCEIDKSVKRRRLGPSERGFAVAFSNTSLAAVLNGYVTKYSEYQWQDVGGVINIRPRAKRPNAFLETRLATFELKDARLTDVVAAIHRAFDVAYAPIATVESQMGANEAAVSRAASEARSVLEKRFSVSLKNARVIDILNEAVRSSGQAFWIVDYDGLPQSYYGSRVTIQTFDGTNTVHNARRQAAR